MQSKQYELCMEVLRRLQKAGVLQNLVLVGTGVFPFIESSSGKWERYTRCEPAT